MVIFLSFSHLRPREARLLSRATYSGLTGLRKGWDKPDARFRQRGRPKGRVSAADVLLLQLGLIIMMAFIGAAIAQRYGHSLMIAYILVGIIIGPFGPLPWKLATVSDVETGVVSQIAKMGLVMLMFFVGLEFYPSKLRKTGAQASVLAAADMAITMFIGFAVCTYLGMSLVDTLFFSCIIAMSSVAVTMKALEELGWQGSRAAEALVGMMVIEDFAFIILLTVGNGLIFGQDMGRGSVLVVMASIAVFVTFFLILIFVFVPGALSHIEKVKHEELFVLLALATVFLSAALAETFGMSAFIGSFFIGVAFAETKLAARLKAKTVAFRDAFAAIFFVTFGMMIDPHGIWEARYLLVIVVPLLLVGEVFVVAATAYLVGHTSRDAMVVGGGTTARSEEAIIFANMGGSLRGAEGEYVLSAKAQPIIYPFTGAFCLIMSAVTPYLMRASNRLADGLGEALPVWLVSSGKSLVAGVSKAVSPDEASRKGHLGLAAGAVVAFTILIIGIAPTLGALSTDKPDNALMVRLLLVSVAIACSAFFFLSLRAASGNDNFTACAITGLVALVQSVVLLWPFSYAYSLAAAGLYLAILLAACALHGRRLPAAGRPG